MEAFLVFLAFIVILVVYSLIVWGLSSLIRVKNGRNPFWWIFFLWIMGMIIVLLLDIRDGVKEEKEA